MTASYSLLPCPFCWRTDLLGFEPTAEGGFLAVKCRACGTHGPAKNAENEAEAAAHWNHRPTHEPPAARKPDKFDLAFEIMRQLEAEDMETMQSCQFGYVMRVTREGAAQPPVPALPEYTNAIGDAGEAYLKSTWSGSGIVPPPLSGRFRWYELWESMGKAAGLSSSETKEV